MEAPSGDWDRRVAAWRGPERSGGATAWGERVANWCLAVWRSVSLFIFSMAWMGDLLVETRLSRAGTVPDFCFFLVWMAFRA
jgi:hypothetical protein